MMGEKERREVRAVEVALTEMPEARERRVLRQRELLALTFFLHRLQEDA